MITNSFPIWPRHGWRMKRKKNLDERIEASSDYLITMKNDSLDFQDAIKENHLLDFKEIFKKEQPVYLEIGCGKGQFGNTFASLNPDKNILCVERNRNVLIMAIDKARELKLDNIMFLCGTAEYLPSYIPNNSIEEIYLNFSCPFPKKSHEAHRLTNPRFLEIYKPMLKKGSAICQKTDNMHFFEYSIESFSKCGFKLSNISLDLHNSDFEGNIETEYEHKFASQGLPIYPIYRLEARLS